MENKQFYYFYSFEKQGFDKFMKYEGVSKIINYYKKYLLGVIEGKSKNGEVVKFAWTNNRNFAVIPDHDKLELWVIRFGRIYSAFNDEKNIIGTLLDNEINISTLEDSLTILSINIKVANTFKVIFILGDHFLCIIYSKKLKIYSLDTKSFIFQSKLKTITSSSDLSLKLSKNILIFINDSIITIVNLKNTIEKFQFHLGDFICNEFRIFKPQSNLLIVVGVNEKISNKAENNTLISNYLLLLIDTEKLEIIYKFQEALISKPLIKENFVILFM